MMPSCERISQWRLPTVISVPIVFLSVQFFYVPYISTYDILISWEGGQLRGPLHTVAKKG